MQMRRELLPLAFLVALWAAIYVTAISSPVLLDDSDAVHAEAIREMVLSGDWVTLTINNGIRYLEKAPLMYWLGALTVSLFGLAEWTVRLPVVLGHLLLALLLYRMGTRFWGTRTGFYAALVYLTSVGPYAFTRILHPDGILTLFIASSFYLYLQVVYEPDPGRKRIGGLDLRCLGIYAAVALAVLTKGLIGIIFVGSIIFCHLLLSGRWEVLKRLQILPGLVVFLIIAAPWHLAAGFANETFFWFYFVNEHFLRYLDLRYPKDHATMPLWLFWVLLLVWVFPWTAFLGGLARHLPRSLRPPTQAAQLNVFLYTWVLLIMIFFSFSTTQEYYTFPVLPALALLLGQVLARLESPEGTGDHRRAVIGLAVFAGCCLIAAIGLVALAWLGSATTEAADLSQTMVPNPDRYLITFGRLQEMTPATFGHLTTIIHQTAALLILGPLAALLTGWRKRWNLTALVFALMMVGVLFCYRAAMLTFEPILTSKSIARVIELNHQPGDRIVVNGIYELSSTINFYTGLQLSVLNGLDGNLWHGSSYPDVPPIFLDDDAFGRLWKSPQRVFFYIGNNDLESFLARNPGFQYRLLAESGGHKLLVNRL